MSRLAGTPEQPGRLSQFDRALSLVSALLTLITLPLIAWFSVTLRWIVYSDLPAKWLNALYVTGLLVAAVAPLAVWVRTRKPRGNDLRRNVPKLDFVWDRRTAAKDLHDVLVKETADAPQIIVMSGQSGVGKSHLIDTVTQGLGREWKVCDKIEGCRSARQFLGDLTGRIDTLGLKPDRVGFDGHTDALLVLDQFEQFLTSQDVREQGIENAVVDQLRVLAKIPRLRILFVVPREFADFMLADPYKRLGVSRAVPLQGLSEADVSRNLDEMNNDLRSGFAKALRLREQAGLPIKLQIVFAMVREIKKGLLNVVAFSDLKCAPGQDPTTVLIQRYLERCAEAAEVEVSHAVLYALSVDRTRKRWFLPSEVAFVTHWDLATVTGVLETLKELDLVVEHSGGYELAHDFYAEQFRELSGKFLEAIPRDNIAYFVAVFEQRREGGKIRTEEGRGSGSLHRGIFVVAIGIVIARLFSPWPSLEGVLGLGSPLASSEMKGTRVVDLLFVPAAIAGAYSAYYEYRFHRYFLRAVTAGHALQQALSWLSLGVCYGLIVVGTLVPRLWIGIIGVAGLAVGFRILALGAIRTHDGTARVAAYREVWTIGLLQCGYMVVMMIGGALHARATYGWNLGERALGDLLLGELVAALVFSAIMGYVIVQHTMPGRVAGYLGVMER